MILRPLLLAGLAGAFLSSAALADIRHVVSFKYKPGVSAEVKADIAKRFIALKDAAQRDGAPYIVSIAGGAAISREGFDQGLEQAFIVTFKNTQDRDYFVGKPYREAMDPHHQALAEQVTPLLAADASGKPTGLFVFDFDDGR